MKSLFGVVVLSLALVGSALAHCGKCGMEGEHSHAAEDKAAAAVHSGEKCPMHAEKNATLLEAATALEASNAALSAKLKDLAAKCCS